VKTNLGGTILSTTEQCLLCVDDVAIADRCSKYISEAVENISKVA
jgi:hypothetical protein